MATYKSSNITDFFKPFAQPRQPKRPMPDNDIEQFQPPRKSRSTTPKNSQDSLPIRSCDNTPSRTLAGAAAPPSQRSSLDAPTESYRDQAADNANDDAREITEKAAAEHLPPFSSQGPVLTSSQRVVKNGEVVIKNSDDEGSDSETSLGDIDELLRSRRPLEPVSSPLTEPDSTSLTPVQQSSPNFRPDFTTSRRTRGSNPVEKYTARQELPAAPKYKFDLESLIKRSKKDELSEEGMARARNLLEALEQREALPTGKKDENADRKGVVDTELVASVMKDHGDEHDTKRLMLAIERTEALQQEHSWSFFENEQETSGIALAAFPHARMEQWQGVLSGSFVER